MAGYFKLNLGDGVASVNAAYVDVDGNRVPSSGLKTYSTSVYLSDIDHFYIDSIASLESGFEYPWTIEYSGYYLSSSITPTSGENSRVNSNVYPDDYRTATVTISATASAIEVGQAEITDYIATTSSIRVYFSADNATYYKLGYRQYGTSSSYTYIDNITTAYKTVTGLSAGTYYQFVCYGKGSDGTLGAVSSSVLVTTKPSAASALYYSSATTSSITVTYTNISSADGHLLTCGSTSVVDDASPYTFSGLKAGTCYALNYQGIVYLYDSALDAGDAEGSANGAGYLSGSALSSDVYIYTTPAKPDSGYLTSTGATSSKISVSMHYVLPANGYQLRYKKSTESSYTVISDDSFTYSGNYAYCTLSNLSGGTTYNISYRPYNTEIDGVTYFGAAVGAWSDDITVTTLAAIGSVGSLTVSSCTTSTVTLVCDSVTNATGYYILYCKSGTSSWQGWTQTTRTQTIEGLSESTTYKFKYYAADSSGNVTGDSSVITATTLASVGKASIDSFTRYSDSIYVTFSASNAASYDVYWRVKGGSSWSYYETTSTAYKIPNLSPGISYEIYCQGFDSSGNEGAASDTEIITTKPADAGTITYTARNTTTIQVSFDAVSGAEAYLVYCDSNSVVTTNTYYTWTGLDSGATYTFQYLPIVSLYAQELDGTDPDITLSDGTPCAAGKASSTIDISTLAEISKGSFTGFNRYTNSIYLAYSATNAAYYLLRYRVLGDSAWTNYNGGAYLATTYRTISGLYPGTSYEFQCRGCDSEKTYFGEWSDTSYITTTPDAAGSIECTAYNTTSVMVSFDAVDGAGAYIVYCGTSSVFTTNTYYTWNDLAPNTTYQFKYQPIAEACNLALDNTKGVSKWGSDLYVYNDASSTISVTTLVEVGQGSFTGFTRNVTTIYLEFEAENATYYKLQYRVAGASSWTSYNSANSGEYLSATSCTVQSLSPGTSYEFQCRGYDSTKNSYGDWSSTVYVTTKPAAAGTISLAARDTTSITVSYSACSGAKAYKIWCNDDNTYVITTSTSYKWEGLSPNTCYKFKYCAIVEIYNQALDSQDSQGSWGGALYAEGSKSSSWTTFTSLQAIGQVSFTGFKRNVTTVYLEFEAENATYYELKYSEKGTNSWTLYKTSTGDTLFSNTSCIISGLFPGTSYEFECYGTDGDASFGTSTNVIVTTKPAAAGTIECDSYDTTSVTVKYSAISGAKAYKVYCGDDSDITTSLSYTWTGLMHNKTYTFKYCAIVELYNTILDNTADLDGNGPDGTWGGALYAEGSTSSGVEVKTKTLVPFWEWEIANGNVSDPDNAATVTQTQTAKSVIDTPGLVSSFSRKVWNDMCDKVNEIAKAAEKSWLTTYATFDNTKMTADDRTLTATKFNSLNHNVRTYKATGIADQVAKSTVYPVRGPFFVTIMEKANEWIDSI